jgi:HSP20 family protein
MANLIRRDDHETDFAPVPTAWDPFDTMRRLMAWDRLRTMNDWPASSWLGGAAASFAPAFELRESPEAYVLEADLPGVAERDLQVELIGSRLTIRGTREHEERREQESYHTYERSYGSFARSFTLPEGTDLERIDAELANGILRVRIPKRADAQPRKIKVGKPVGRLVEKVKGMFGVGEDRKEEGQDARS